MGKRKNQSYCRFMAVCDCLWFMVFAGAAAFFFGIWLTLELYLFFPSGTYVAVILLLTILAILICVGFSAGVIYGIVLLWKEKEGENKKYRVYFALSILLAVAGMIGSIIFAVIGAFSLAINLCFGMVYTVIAVLNAVGFYLKGKEPVQEQTERKKEGQGKQHEKRALKTEDSKGGILGVKGEYAGVVFPIKRGEQIMFGKDPKYCQILFRDSHISRVHLSVYYRDDLRGYELMDYSKNGTFWENGERLPGRITCQCNPGTIFTMQHEKQVFQLL